MDSPPSSVTPSSPLHHVLWPAADPSPSTLPCPDLLAGAAGAICRLVTAHSRHFLALSSLLLLPLTLLLLASPPRHRLLLVLPCCAHRRPPVPACRSMVEPPAGAPPAPRSRRRASLPGRLRRLHGQRARGVLRPPRQASRFAPLRVGVPLAPHSHRSPGHPPPPHPTPPTPSPQLGAGLAVLGFVLLSPFWSLAGAAAVVESTTGLAPLRRSCRLLSGARLAALSAFFVFAAGVRATLWAFGGVVAAATYDASAGWAGMAPVVVKAVAGTALLALQMLYGMVANVVLYMHCRALHGELTGEIFNEFTDMYVFLPYDDGKNRHVVSVITAWP